jgi:hypothetical protein
MKPERLPKKQYLKLRDGGPIGIKGKPYSRKNWRKELTDDGLETEAKWNSRMGLCDELEEGGVLSEQSRSDSQDKTPNATKAKTTK